jgi:hypothetical protein
MGRRPTIMLAPELTDEQRRAVEIFELAQWMPSLVRLSTTYHQRIADGRATRAV